MAVTLTHDKDNLFFFSGLGPSIKLKQIIQVRLFKRGNRIDCRRLKPNQKHGPHVFAETSKLEPCSVLRNATAIYLLTSRRERAREQISLKSAALMIDSRHTEHPGLSGHFACTCSAFSAVNVCGSTILKSHTVLLAPMGEGGRLGWGRD